MAPTLLGLRCGATVTSRVVRREVQLRAFSLAPQRWAASDFVMPAMSPTMTEGNIAKWNFKEGDSFNAGDVLLDIETDKAQMDVEAQDDGILAKVMQPNGSKSIKVGTRIAVIAEPSDNLSTLEIPSEDAKKATSSGQSQPVPSQEQQQPLQSSSESSQAKPMVSSSANPNQAPQRYPIYPAVQALLRANGVDAEAMSQIPASGPNGRLLKGDVLSWLGKIKNDYSAQQSERIKKMGHLDLSNVQRAQPKPQPKSAPPKVEPAAEPEINLDTEVAVSISLKAVLATQRRIQDTLGLVLPLSTFIARASEIANESLPRANHAPTEDELYDAVLGLDKIKKTSRGAYAPQVTALAARAVARGPERRQTHEDVMDVLTGSRKAKFQNAKAPVVSAAGAASSNSINTFSVSAKRGEEKRARTFLERMKTVLEAEPGRCVL